MATDAKRRQLGRGLSSLLGDDGDEAPAGGGGGVRTLPIEFMHPGRYQPRRTMDSGRIDELARSIREQGIIQPILVRHDPIDPSRYEIIAGERRWRAAQVAQVHEVPVLVRDLTDREALEVALVENLQRQDLSPLEEAEGYRRLMDEFTHTQEELAGAVGKSRSHVANMMRLLSLPEPVKDLIDGGHLSAGHARALVGLEDAESLAREVVKKGLNVRQTEKLAKKASIPPAPAGQGPGRRVSPGKDPDTLALERDLGALLGLRVEITFGPDGGQLSLHYKNLEQLDDILHRLSHGKHGDPAQRRDVDMDPLGDGEEFQIADGES
ncbi:MAG: ParB/RepB/Spo0J family partition protein [Hyphomicrobiales bacterium]|nr:ParB/RepB/Spo0J family partition protein [Hyphomicrobiales bacterium]MCP5370471.1 ParB/RepB/Spo0J family partition protein [Hyphomicrobiales bacterium]